MHAIACWRRIFLFACPIFLPFSFAKMRDLKLGAQLANVLNRSLKQLTESFVSDSTCICGSIQDRRTCNAAVSLITFHKHALQTQPHFIKSTCGNCIRGHYSRIMLWGAYKRKETSLTRSITSLTLFLNLAPFCYIYITKIMREFNLKKIVIAFILQSIIAFIIFAIFPEKVCLRLLEGLCHRK